MIPRILAAAVLALAPAAFAAGKAEHVVMVVWDGMRPDFVSKQNTPTLYQLARRGVEFKNHHAVYLSSTEVNGTALATGAYPANSTIMANNEYRPKINALKSVHTEDLDVIRKGDEMTDGHYLKFPTVAETVRAAGKTTAVSGAKPVALLADRSARVALEKGVNFYGGNTLPSNVMAGLKEQHGEFPGATATGPTRNDWTTSTLLDTLWKDGVPTFSLLWLNEPDYSQHFTGPGSEKTVAAIRNADANLARVLKALDARGLREKTDVILVSDHGCSTVSARVDLVKSLNEAGIKAVREFKAKPADGEVLVISNGGSTLVYVIGHDEKRIQEVVNFLQRWENTGVVFTKNGLPGTFPLSQVHVDSPDAPDILVSMRWEADKSPTGAPGMVFAEVSGFGPNQGIHVSLSPYDMHNTLVAAGPDFRPGVVNALPSGNVDIAPTILWLLGIEPKQPLDGRVLSEALTIPGPKLTSYEPRRLEATNQIGTTVWQQYLNYSEVNGVIYLDEGNGRQVRP